MSEVKKRFTLTLDDFCEDIFHHLEDISEGVNGHECVIYATNRSDAAGLLMARTLEFFTNSLDEDK
jgi:hypothetical protein